MYPGTHMRRGWTLVILPTIAIRTQQPPNNQWRAQSQQQANHAYQMAAQGPPPQYQMAAQGPLPQYPPQWTQHPRPNQYYPNGPPANQGGPWGQGYP
eukprot:scaffold90228_cov31-Attheya_sp.AAC.1